MRACLEQEDRAATLGELTGDDAATRAGTDHHDVENLFHATPKYDQSFSSLVASGELKSISFHAPVHVPPWRDEVAVERLDGERAHHRELGREHVLGERVRPLGGSRSELVDRRERLSLQGRRHIREEGVDVDDGADASRARGR